MLSLDAVQKQGRQFFSQMIQVRKGTHWRFVGQKVGYSSIKKNFFFLKLIVPEFQNLLIIFKNMFNFSTGIHLLCTFHFLQAFWRWLYDSKHQIKKEDRAPIMEKVKKILYSSSYSEMDMHYYEFTQKFYSYSLLRKHFNLLWERCQYWALSFHVGLPMRGNNTNNYIE